MSSPLFNSLSCTPVASTTIYSKGETKSASTHSSTQYPQLPSYAEHLKTVPLFDQDKTGTFRDFLYHSRLFTGVMPKEKKLEVLCNMLKADPHYRTFLKEDCMTKGTFEIPTSYGAILDACSEGLESYVRGGFVRAIFKNWFKECAQRQDPQVKLRTFATSEPLPDVDFVIDAPKQNFQQLKAREQLIFRHLAACMSRDNPNLFNCYNVVVSFCCSLKRAEKEPLYTLTTLPCKDAPALEIVICEHFERNVLSELDALCIDLKTEKVRCNRPNSTEHDLWTAVLDNAHYQLTVIDPESVDELGLARLISHTVKGATVRGVGIIKTIYDSNLKSQRPENFITYIPKCCTNHLSGCSRSLAAMYWNLYVLTGAKEQLFYDKAREEEALGLGFQKQSISELQQWAIDELSNPDSDVQIEWVQSEGVDWIRVVQDGVYWFIPPFTLSDDALLKLHAGNKLPDALVRANFSHSHVFDQQLPLALIQQDQAKWHSLALKRFKALPRKEQKAIAEQMIRLGSPRAIDSLFTIYENDHSPALFFILAEKTRVFAHHNNASMQIDQLCQLAIPLAKLKSKVAAFPYASVCGWLITQCPDSYKAYNLYTSFVAKEFMANNPAVLLERMDFDSMSATTLMNHPAFRLVNTAKRLKYLTRAIRNDPFHSLDYLFYRCFSSGLIDTPMARRLFEDLIPEFSFTVLDWVIELYPSDQPIPLEVYKRLPARVREGLGYRTVLQAPQLMHFIRNHRGTSADLHTVLVKYANVIDENLDLIFYNLVELICGLVDGKHHKQIAIWMPRIMQQPMRIPREKRIKFVKWCIEQGRFEWAYSLALTLKQISHSQAQAFATCKNLSLVQKCTLFRSLEISQIAPWQALANAHPHAPNLALQVLESVNSNTITRAEAEQLLAPVLARNLASLEGEESVAIFETALGIMTFFPALATLACRRVLASAAGNYFLKSDDSSENADQCYRLFKADPETLQKYILALAASNQSFEVHAHALRYLSESTNQNFYPHVCFHVMGLATIWQSPSVHAAALTSIAEYLAEKLPENKESISDYAMDLIRFLVEIRVYQVNVICGRLIQQYNSAIDRKEFDSWGRIIERWVMHSFQLPPPNGFDASDAERLHSVLSHSIFIKNPYMNKHKIRIAKSYCQFARDQHKGVHTDASFAFCFKAIDFVNNTSKDIQSSSKDHAEIAPLAIEVFALLLAPQRDLCILLHRFNKFWINFLTSEIVPEMPSKAAVYPDEQTARDDLESFRQKLGANQPVFFSEKTISRQVVLLTKTCRARRFNEVKLKAELLCKFIDRFCIPGIDFRTFLPTFDQFFDDLVDEFPDQSRVLLTVLHRYAFALTPPSEPDFAALCKGHTTASIGKAYRKLKMSEAPIESFEFNFFYNGIFLDFNSQSKNTELASALIMRVINTGHPAWVWDALSHVDLLASRMLESEHLLFTSQVYVAAARALSRMSHPNPREDILLINEIYKEFDKTVLTKAPTALKNGWSLRHDTACDLIEGGIAHLELCASHPDYLKILDQVLSMIAQNCASAHSADGMQRYFNYYQKVMNVLIKHPVDTTALGRFFSRLNFDPKIPHHPKVKLKRLELLNQMLGMISLGEAGDKARASLKKLAAHFNWFADVPDAEILG